MPIQKINMAINWFYTSSRLCALPTGQAGFPAKNKHFKKGPDPL